MSISLTIFDTWVLILAQPEFVCMALGKTENMGLNTYLHWVLCVPCFVPCKQYEMKIIGISILEISKQMELQGAELACHGSWPSS